MVVEIRAQQYTVLGVPDASDGRGQSVHHRLLRCVNTRFSLIWLGGDVWSEENGSRKEGWLSQPTWHQQTNHMTASSDAPSMTITSLGALANPLIVSSAQQTGIVTWQYGIGSELRLTNEPEQSSLQFRLSCFVLYLNRVSRLTTLRGHLPVHNIMSCVLPCVALLCVVHRRPVY